MNEKWNRVWSIGRTENRGKRRLLWGASLLVMLAGFLGGCAFFSSLFGALAEFEREVDELRSRPRTNIADLSPRGLRVYLYAFPEVDTGEEFLEALPPEYKQDWIMMSRSESLQAGIAAFPRIILSGEGYTRVFGFTLKGDPGFPLAHPNVIEYMEFDRSTNRFHFHEIDLRRDPFRRVSEDDSKCLKCHSGRPGTDPSDSSTPRPNWDAYDSWSGMLPFNRDRIYEGSVEEAAMERLLNLTDNPESAPILRQLALPRGITRATDGTIRIEYGGSDPSTTTRNDYRFDGRRASSPPAGSPVPQGGRFLTIDQATDAGVDVDGNPDQGRGVELFDGLTRHNAKRVAQELINHPKDPVDVRPIALAIANNCITEGNLNTYTDLDPDTASDPVFEFFKSRNNGMDFGAILRDTDKRRSSLPWRKADLQEMNLKGLISAYGSDTVSGTDDADERIRREVFRRPPAFFRLDQTTGLMIDREVYTDNSENTRIALFRFFLEPLGVAVDKWSMSVRGRSRTYTFADQFSVYIGEIRSTLGSSLEMEAMQSNCEQLKARIQMEFRRLPSQNTIPVPPYAEVQRIFNRNCTECHGGFRYPSYRGSLDLSNGVSYNNLIRRNLIDRDNRDNPEASVLFQRITEEGAPMPPGGPPLSGADIDTIRRWIEGGAHE